MNYSVAILKEHLEVLKIELLKIESLNLNNHLETSDYQDSYNELNEKINNINECLKILNAYMLYNTNKMSELKDKVLEEYKNGNIVIATPEGLQVINLSEFIKQPVDGLLYDLNKNEAIVLTFIDDPRWINDYAVCQVIRALKSKIDELKNNKDFVEKDFQVILNKPEIKIGSEVIITGNKGKIIKEEEEYYVIELERPDKLNCKILKIKKESFNYLTYP